MVSLWYNDLNGFFAANHITEIIPTGAMSMVEKLNALFRLSIYMSLALILVTKDLRYLLLPMIVAIITLLAGESEQQKIKAKESFLNDNDLTVDPILGSLRIKPTVDNPFMNVLMSDYALKPNRPAALNAGVLVEHEYKKIDEQVADCFNKTLVRDVGDLFENQSSQRNYYTMPCTTIPNNQGGFADWLYKIPGKTFKELGTTPNAVPSF